jgi:hypothetical protein
LHGIHVIHFINDLSKKINYEFLDLIKLLNFYRVSFNLRFLKKSISNSKNLKHMFRPPK